MASRCRSWAEQAWRDEAALQGLEHHLRFVVDGAPADHPDLEVARTALADMVPVVIPPMPEFEDAGRDFERYEALLSPWHTLAEVVVPERRAWLGRVRTLAIRLGDAVTEWTAAQAALRRYELDAHRAARPWARTLWIRGAQAIINRGVTPERWAELRGQIEAVEALDEAALLRWLAPLG
jgi:hypothetical protein